MRNRYRERKARKVYHVYECLLEGYRLMDFASRQEALKARYDLAKREGRPVDDWLIVGPVKAGARVL